MSGGVNVKSGLRGPPSTGIPLPRSLRPSSPKADPPCHRATDLQKPSTLTPKHTPTHTPSHSPSLYKRHSNIPGPASRDLPRSSGLKSQLLQRTGALPAPQVSRSAYSSPLTQRRVPPPPHSKDTLDIGKSAHGPTQFSHDGNRNRSTFINKNQTPGASNLQPPLHFRRGDNSNTLTHPRSDSIPARVEEPPENLLQQATMLTNGNLRPALPQSNYKLAARGCSGSSSQSDEEMGTPEENSPASSPCPMPLPPITFAMPALSTMSVDPQDFREASAADTHIPKVNMATVAPFSYRLQVQESEFSVDELSDCSSGSIEVCCDDLTPGKRKRDNELLEYFKDADNWLVEETTRERTERVRDHEMTTRECTERVRDHEMTAAMLGFMGRMVAALQKTMQK